MDVHITVICRKDKINKRNEAPLALKISQNRTCKKVSLGVNVDPQFWDESKNQLK